MLIATIFAVIIGFGMGVAINALSDAMPVHRRPRLPQYQNDSVRPVIAWSGLIAYLTNNRLDNDNENITWRHPIVEILTAIMFGWVVYTFYGDQSALRLFIWLTYLSILMLIIVIDVEHRLILFPLIIPASAIALTLSTVFPPEGQGYFNSIIGGVSGFLLFFLLFNGGALFNRLITGKDIAFGFGDVMLAMLCGFMIGFPNILLSSIITVFLGGFGAIIYIVYQLIAGKFSMFKPIPYGPYIAIGAALFLIFPEEMKSLIIN